MEPMFFAVVVDKEFDAGRFGPMETVKLFL